MALTYATTLYFTLVKLLLSCRILGLMYRDVGSAVEGGGLTPPLPQIDFGLTLTFRPPPLILKYHIFNLNINDSLKVLVGIFETRGCRINNAYRSPLVPRLLNMDNKKAQRGGSES